MVTTMLSSDLHWQDAITYIRHGPPAEAVSLCISELRTPFTSICGWADLLSRLLAEQWACQALAQSLLAYSRVFTDALITDELLDLRRLLIQGFPALHPDVWNEHDPPVRRWSEPLDQAVLAIAQRMRELMMHIRATNQQLQRACSHRLEPEMQALFPLIELQLDQLQRVVDGLLATTLVERIRQLPNE
jgi:hypothetical protein